MLQKYNLIICYLINTNDIINKNTIKLLNNEIKFDNYKFEGEIYLGIRPEDIFFNSKNDIKLNLNIELIENLGFEKIVYSSIQNKNFIVKTSENITDSTKEVSFSQEKIYLFDKNKKRIRS